MNILNLTFHILSGYNSVALEFVFKREVYFREGQTRGTVSQECLLNYSVTKKIFQIFQLGLVNWCILDRGNQAPFYLV